MALVISNVPNTTDHYLEWNDQSNACVNGVKTIQLSADELSIELLPEAAKQLGEKAFTIEFDCDEELFTEISRCLTLIFGHKLVLNKQKEARKKTVPPQKDYSKIKYLNLEGKNLQKLPDEVFELTQLQALILIFNYFERIPDAIGRLKGLKKLVFIEARFESLPDSIGELSNLEFFEHQ